MRRKRKASYTIEAAIYIPIILFMMANALKIGLNFFQESRQYEVNKKLEEFSAVEEFYYYHILDEVGREIADDKQ